MDERTEELSYRTLFRDPLLLIVTLVSFTATFGSYAASPALPSIVASLGVSEGRVGLVMTAFVLPAVFVLPVAGVLSDVYGRKTILVPSLLLFGVAGTAIAFVDSFAAILALRVLQGVGGAAIIPIAITLLGDVYSGPAGSSAQGFRLSANGLSGILLPVLAGFAAGIAWYYPFLSYATAIPVALLAYLYVPETLETAAPTSLADELRTYATAIRAEATDVDMAVVLLGGFFQGVAYFAILTFVPLFAVARLDASVFVAGSLLAARGVARIALSPFTGSFEQRVSRRTALVSTLVVSAIGTGLIAVAPTVAVLALVVGLFGIGDALFTPVHRFAVTDLAPTEHRAGLVSGMQILRQFGATLSPAVFGLLLAVVDYEGVFLMAAGVYGLYALLVLVVFSPDG